MIYLPRRIGGRGLNSIEQEYKLIKIKAAVNLYRNQDPTMGLVREFEEKAVKLRRRSITKDVEKYSKELGLDLQLIHTNPIGQELIHEKWQGTILETEMG